MKHLNNNNLKRILLPLLATGLIFFGVLSIVSMKHEMTMPTMGVVLSQNSDCSNSASTQACINYHFGVLKNLSTATHSSMGLKFISLLALVLSGLLIFALFKVLDYFYTSHRIRLRQLYEKTITAFAQQLGNWLTLLEKRDPSYAFSLA